MRTDITIRPETPAERDEINEMVRRSFAEGTPYSDGAGEVAFLHDLRAGQWFHPELAFVAELDGQIVGQVMFTEFPLSTAFAKGTWSADLPCSLVMMTPVAVHADQLGQGIGTAMLTQAIEHVIGLGTYRGILVEGSSDFYHRFGFVRSGEFGIEPGETCVFPQTHPECMMAMETSPGSLAGINGYVNYDMYPSLMSDEFQSIENMEPAP